MKQLSSDPAPTPLDGVRVLESSSSQACRLAGMLLADLGADVVRTVGSSERDLADPQTLGWDRGKRFAGVGSSAEAARLAESAHVVLDDGTGLYSAAAGTANPRLVRVQLPPYGVVGRESDLPADPLLLSALSGFASVHPSYDPGTPIASVVSVLAGIHGAFGAVAAVAGLIEATETGRGRTLVTTGLDAGAAALSTLVMTGIDVDVVLSPGGRPDSRPSFRVYRCADGEYLHLAALTAEFFLPALDVLGRVDVMVMPGVDGEFMNVNRPEIAATVSPELERTFATRPRDEWVAALTAAGVPCAPVQSRVEWTMSDFVASAAPPVTREHPDLGEVVQPGTPFWFTDATVRPGALPTRSRFLRATDVWRDPAPVPASERGTSEPRRLPLDGLRVLDASTFLAGPTVGALMSDLGASVAKVESPSGDPYAVYAPSYASVNYGKTIGALDQRTPAGRASMVELLTDADVLIDNLRPSVARRLGLDRESVAAVNDRLIKVSVSGYGPDGPHAETPAFDPVLQSLSGMARAQGGSGEPVTAVAPILDVCTGALAAAAALAAVFSTTTRRRGEHTGSSLAAAASYVQLAELTVFPGCPAPEDGDRDYRGPQPWRRYHRASDGWIAVAAQTPDQVSALASATAAVSLTHDGVAVAVAQQPVEQWIGELSRAGVPVCRVTPAGGLLEDPLLIANGFSHVVRIPDLGRFRLARGYFTDLGVDSADRTARVWRLAAEAFDAAGTRHPGYGVIAEAE